jgi:hypothetical protein
MHFFCRHCGVPQTWTAEAQREYYEETKAPCYDTAVRCRACRAKERDRKALAKIAGDRAKFTHPAKVETKRKKQASQASEEHRNECGRVLMQPEHSHPGCVALRSSRPFSAPRSEQPRLHTFGTSVFLFHRKIEPPHHGAVTLTENWAVGLGIYRRQC